MGRWLLVGGIFQASGYLLWRSLEKGLMEQTLNRMMALVSMKAIFWHSGKVSLQMYFFQNIQGESSLIRDFCFAEVVDEYASLFTSHFTSYSFVELYSCSTLLALPMCIYFSVDKRVWNLVLQHYKSASEILIPRYSHCSILCVGFSNVLNSFQL